MRRSVYIAAFALLGMLAVPNAMADAPSANDVILPPTPTYEATNVTVHEQTGSVIPLDATFRTSDGAKVTLSDVIHGDLPTILTFNYSDCPMLCSLQLNGLSAALPELAKATDVDTIKGATTTTEHESDAKKVAFRIGTQFRLVTIDLEPKESLEKLSRMKDKYIAQLPEADRAAARAGWTFLAAATPGDPTQISRVAKTVGFDYVYLPDRAEYAHPAALIFLSTRGVVSRYVYGIDFPVDMMRESIIKAGLAEPQTAVGFMNRCYHYDPSTKDHSRAGVVALRVGAAGFLVLLVTGLGVLHVRRRREVG